uniref:Ethylene response factor 13 n=1 Tax=Diospyros kaki TaxID=35925 RepID=A0A068ER16_DIOKA|nr:ethylene response factor 13 [Diospyros kaki]
MSSSSEGSGSSTTADPTKSYRGVRRRKWGKWVSEIRVPGTQERLWLGSYSTPEAAAVAHDIASYCLRGPASLQKLNFPLTLPAGARPGMSPKSVQKAASDAGMAVDAQFAMKQSNGSARNDQVGVAEQSSADYHLQSASRSQGEDLNISVEDYL